MTALSLRARLTLWYSFALAAIVMLVATDVLWVVGRIGTRRVDRELDDLLQTSARVIAAERQEGSPLESAAREVAGTLRARGQAIAIFDGRGVRLAASGGQLHLPLPNELVRAGVWTERAGPMRWRVRERQVAPGGNTVTLLVGASLLDIAREQHEVEEAMVVGIPIALILAVAGGWWLAAIGLRPVTTMAARAAALAPGSLEDLGQTHRRDELGQLAAAFNGLVSRLRMALQTQRQFTADASHELRTPVSVIRTAADVALSRPNRTEAEYRDTLAIVRDESRRLGHLVADMLVLARADAGGYTPRAGALYFDEILAECERAVSVLAADRQVTIESPRRPELAMSGDEEMLRQMVLNVLQNAVQHTPPGGAVRVTAESDGAVMRVRVIDAGPGIPACDWERMFERFVQLDPARRGVGSGLGLPIARWAASIHRGRVVVEQSGPAGTTMLIELPLNGLTSQAGAASPA